MADVGVPYTLTTPGGMVIFNDDSLDQFYITEITGLGIPSLRTPIDNVPLGDGGLIHDFWKGPRHIGIEGILLIESTTIGDEIVDIRNEMELELTDALESILRNDGSFSFTPIGQGTRTFTVRHDIPLEFRHIENYLTEQFTFGLVAAEPDWAGSS